MEWIGKLALENKGVLSNTGHYPHIGDIYNFLWQIPAFIQMICRERDRKVIVEMMMIMPDCRMKAGSSGRSGLLAAASLIELKEAVKLFSVLSDSLKLNQGRRGENVPEFTKEEALTASLGNQLLWTHEWHCRNRNRRSSRAQCTWHAWFSTWKQHRPHLPL